MQIYVCVKHVPDTAANIKVTGQTSFDESVKFVVNPYDEYAIQEAEKIVKEKGGEVIVVTVGKKGAVTTLRSALAVGGDRGILVETDEQFTDSMTTAAALKQAIEKDGTPDLIFTGKQSVDSEGMQTGYRLAAAFDMPAASEVVGFELSDGKALIEREIGGGEKEILEIGIPCVIGATKGLNEPRYPKLPDIMKAKKKKVDQIKLDDLGSFESAMELVGLEQVPERGQAKILDGAIPSAVGELVRLLREEAKVL